MNTPEKKYTWYKIAEHPDELGLGVNGMATVAAGGKELCIARTDGAWAACTAKCPHAGGSMSQGYVDASGNIVCPLHRYKFSLKNGRNTSGEGYFLKTYPVEQREDGLYVGIAPTGIF